MHLPVRLSAPSPDFRTWEATQSGRAIMTKESIGDNRGHVIIETCTGSLVAFLVVGRQTAPYSPELALAGGITLHLVAELIVIRSES